MQRAKNLRIIAGVSAAATIIAAVVAVAVLFFGQQVPLSPPAASVTDQIAGTIATTPPADNNGDGREDAAVPSGGEGGGAEESEAQQQHAPDPPSLPPVAQIFQPTRPALDELRQHALQKINDDRAQFGLPPVQLSDNAAAQAHAEDIFRTKKISHWMTNGEKPYMTYTRYGGTGEVGQNVAVEGYSEADATACRYGLAICKHTDPVKAIENAQYSMMYEDEECCNNGHRDNILDREHTHVSIGIMYDDYFFAFVQNFESQYVQWARPIMRDAGTNSVDMGGELAAGLEMSSISIYFDPLPTNETYLQNLDRTSYDNGALAAYVLPAGWFLDDPSILTIESARWAQDGQSFEISFSLEQVTARHGNGVYTIGLIARNEAGELMRVTSTAIFVQG